ncbi:MAG: DsbA family protein [Rickettsiales bacterium]
MKTTHFLIGLLAGTALGGAVVAATGTTTHSASGASGLSRDEIQQIVRDTISNEPQLILDSVQKFQQGQRNAAMGKANESLKNSDVRAAIFNNEQLAIGGNKNGTHVVAEFFDYDCPVCKTQFKVLAEMLKKDPELKIVFHEFPIFGPVSEENSRIGLAVTKLYPEKYYAFHEKMMGGEGHQKTTKRTYEILKELGMDEAKIKTSSNSEEIIKQLADSRALGEKLSIQGTPALIIGDEITPHFLPEEELQAKFAAPANAAK